MTALERLLTLPKYGKPGVNERMQALTDGLDMVPSIKIVGSNGKGTTAHMMAQMAMGLGKKVGLYTSPHLLEIGERIQVNGRSVSKRDLNYLLDWALQRAEGREGVGRFEVLTLAALFHFAQSGVDLAVMEVGLGGRYDPVRIAPGKVSVLTSLDLEHTAILGESIEEIAREKCAICRPGETLISAVDNIAPYLPDGVEVLEITRPALAPLQSNARLAAHALRHHFGLPHLPETFALKVPGRLHKLSNTPALYIDVAHTPAAIRTVVDHFPDRPISLICAFQDGKNLHGIEHSFHHVAALRFEEEMMAPEFIIEQFTAHHHSFCNDVEEALKCVKATLPENGVIIALGGFAIAGRMLAHIRGLHYDVIRL